MLTRSFNAPRSLVWRAWTEPELVKRWNDVRPPGWTFPVCEIDLRVDGHYHYVQCNDDLSFQWGVSGTYLDVAPPTRLHYTEQFDKSPSADHTHVTVTFTECSGQTTIAVYLDFASSAVRHGPHWYRKVGESYDMLAELLSTLE